jgi:hypothetical protein
MQPSIAGRMVNQSAAIDHVRDRIRHKLAEAKPYTAEQGCFQDKYISIS